jgi:succinate dehydrogenase (ubiquinone) membrane anchor subunit
MPPSWKSILHFPTLEEQAAHKGSKHWKYERILSVLSFGLIGAAWYAPTNQPINYALGVVIPIHCHLGFDSVITDYVPRRKYRLLNALCMSFLYAGTAATIYGLWEFNRKDVGIALGVKKILFLSKGKEGEKDASKAKETIKK